MTKITVDTVIISDIHLGFKFCRADKLLDTLKQYEFKRLILNGDIFDDLNFKRLHSEHWEVLSYFRHLSRDHEVVWIIGNHDGQAKILSRLIGVPVHDSYRWRESGRLFLAIHGHQFDRFISRNLFISNLAGSLYYFLKRLEWGNDFLTDWIRQYNGSWLRLSDEVEAGAVRLGQRQGAKVVFCGHTHIPLISHRGVIRYYNSGSWVEFPSNLITIKRGKVSLVNVD